MSNRRDLRPVTLILSASLVLVVWGLLTVYNTSSAEIIDRAQARSIHAALLRQGMYAGLGLCAGSLAWWIGPQPLLRHPWIVWGVICLALAACFIPGIGQAANGASRWLRVGPVSIQPSELAKLALPVLAVAWLRREESISLLRFFKCMVACAVPIGLILIEPDNGTTLITLFSLGLVLFLGRVPAKFWALPMSVLLLIGGAAASQMPHVHHRLAVYLHPELDLKGKGHQPYQARIAVGSGGFSGRGLGKGLQKLEYLPEAQNDYIAAIVAEEAGFLGMTGLIALYCSLLMGGTWVAMRLQSWDQVLAASLIALLCVQAFLNLGVVSGVLPSTGINLPLFSQGGTSLLCNLILVGWLVRFGAMPRQQWPSAAAKKPSEVQKAARISFSTRYWQEKPKSLA